MVAILNFSKITCTFPDGGKCDSTISIFQFLRSQENMKFIHGGHYEFQKNLKKITCASPYRGGCDSKIRIISDLKFWSFCANKKNLE